MYPHRPPRSCATTPSAASSPARRRGLYAYVGHRVVELLTETQLVDHAVSVLPQLQSVTARPHFHGPHWTTLRKKNGVELFEFDPLSSSASTNGTSLATTPNDHRTSTLGSSSHATTAPSTSTAALSTRSSALPHSFQTKFKLPNPGIDMAYAVVAQCELEGSVHDILDTLFNDEPVEFEASMKALWASKLKRGDLLLSRNVRGRSATFTDSSSRSNQPSHLDLEELLVREPGRLAIKSATVGAGINFHRKRMGAEKLCYTSFTQQTPATNEAFHVVKTLPREVHDQIACGKTHVALRGAGLDHIAVGYHLTGINSVLGGTRTRLVVCAYVSSVSTTTVSRASQLHWHPRMDSAGLNGGSSSVSSDARRVVMLLAKAARNFQQLVRQRRFGNQRFVYFPTDRHSNRALEQCCVVCLRRFGLFRKDHYCQLCGHLVCRLCSKKHKVEPFAGKVRENRICFPCVARVDSGTFHDEQLWRNMGGRAVVVDADAISPVGFEPILEAEASDAHSRHDATEMTPFELALQDEDKDEDYADLDRSYGSADSGGSASTAPSSVRREIQVAQDLFSPHPERRASALEALGRVVLETRNSMDYRAAPTPRARAMDPVVVDKYMKEKKTRTSLTKQHQRPPRTKSDRMETFSVCYPRANPTTSQSFASMMTPLLESAGQQRDSWKLKGRTSSAFAIDTAAFDSICESVIQRLGFAMVFLVIHRRKGKPQIVGMHQSPRIRGTLPRHLDLASYCPSGLATDANTPLIVIDPTRDLRFREFPLVHDARIRFFAEFPLRDLHASGRHAVRAASLCVLDTEVRTQQLSKHEMMTVKTLCAVASDLIASISH